MGANQIKRPGSRFALVRVVASAAIIGLILFVALISLAPDAVAFSPNNYGWNGLQGIFSTYSVDPVGSISGVKLGENRSVLLIMQPVTQFSPSYAGKVSSFVEQGGTLVVADSEGSSNSLLREMGVAINIETQYAISDPVYNWRASSLPTALVLPSTELGGLLHGVRGIAMNRPSPLDIGTGASAFAISSQLSFESNRSSGGLVPGNPKPIANGPFVVAAYEMMGKGLVLVIGGSEFFTNSMSRVADNGALISNVLSNSKVFLDVSHWPANTAGNLKSFFDSAYASLSQFPFNLILTLCFVGVSLVLLPVFSGVVGARVREPIWDHDTSFDEKILKRVRRDREKYGIVS